MLVKLHSEMQNFVVDSSPGYVYTESVKPNVWLSPKYIFEVKAAGFSVSPIYSTASKLNKKGGISLRFPRFIKLREDKGIKDVTTSKQVLYMFNEFAADNDASDDIFN
ncbi:ATP-dependent DNA ligase Cdc17 [Binucleata daphniae]